MMMPTGPMRQTCTMTFAALAILAATSSAIAAAPTLLTPVQIKTIFGTGRPFSAVSAAGTKSYSFTFNTDGSALEIPAARGKRTSGTWRLSDNGYCTTWGNGTETCYTIEARAQGYVVRDSAGSAYQFGRPSITSRPLRRANDVR